jgi:hypothetical protein
MEEVLKALGPWPTVQGIAIGIVVAAVGIWAMRRGMQDSKKSEPNVEDIKARWELQKWMAHIHENSFDIVKLLEKSNELSERSNELLEQTIAAINRVFDTRWNTRQ